MTALRAFSDHRFLVVAGIVGMLGSGLLCPDRVWAATSVAMPSAAVAAAPAEGLAKIVVRPAILVDQARVDASHLAVGALSDHLREALAKIPVGMIAQPLGEFSLARADLERKLGSLAGLFELPERIQIRRRGELLPGSEVENRIREVVTGRDPSVPASELRIDCSRLPKNIVLPGMIESWQVTPMSNNTLGMCIFALDAICQNGKVRQIIQIQVTREVAAAKVRRLLKRGASVTPEDVMIETVRITSGHAQVPLTIDQVVGKHVGVFKSPGSFLRPTDLADGAGASSQDSNADRTLQSAGSLGLAKVCSVQTGDSPVLTRAGKARLEDAINPQAKNRETLDIGDPELSSLDVEPVEVPASKLKTFPGEVGSAMSAPARAPLTDKANRRIGPKLGQHMASAMSAAASAGHGSKTAGWIVKPGDRVDFSVKRGGLTISVPARALDGGPEGAEIRLVNLQNQRQIHGVVVGKGMVEYAE